MNKPRMWWAGDELGWMIDTDTCLSAEEVRRTIQYTLQVQKDRLLTLVPGDRRDECERTIAALRLGRVTQNITKARGDVVLFDAYKSEGQKLFTLGGV